MLGIFEIPKAISTIALVVAFTIGPAQASNVETKESVPKLFHGDWALDPGYCNKTHIANLSIGPSLLQFWESTGRVISVVVKDERELALILDFTGEGEQWIGLIHFKVSEDGNYLTDLENPHPKNRRERC